MLIKMKKALKNLATAHFTKTVRRVVKTPHFKNSLPILPNLPISKNSRPPTPPSTPPLPLSRQNFQVN